MTARAARVISAAVVVAVTVACDGGNGGPTSPSMPAPVTGTDACAALGASSAAGEGERPAILSGTVCNPAGSAVVRLNLRTVDGFSAGICSGTIITPRAVLTAAHCLDGDVRGALVFLGVGEQIPAASFVYYPGYSFNAANVFDVGVVLVDQDLPHAPLPILTSREGRSGEAAVIAGWGRDEQDITTQLKAGSTTISRVTPAYLETLFAPPSASVCSGDSGGSILLSEGGRWAIAGITSATSSSDCNTGTNFFQAVANSNVRGFILEHVPGVGQR